MRKILFIDRDGTLIENTGYLHRPEDVSWKSGVLSTLKILQIQGWEFVVITNQSGIARAKYQVKHMNQVHESMMKDLALFNIKVLSWQFCPHHPDITGPCACRKPQVGMIANGLKSSLGMTAYSVDELLQVEPQVLEEELHTLMDQQDLLGIIVGDAITDAQVGPKAKMDSFLILDKEKIVSEFKTFQSIGEFGQFLLKAYP